MRTLALVATLLGVAASGAGAQRVGSHTSSRMDTTLAFPRDGNVEVSIPAGDVTITGWDRDAARVVATCGGNASCSQMIRSMSVRLVPTRWKGRRPHKSSYMSTPST